jgi:hypothetical protein
LFTTRLDFELPESYKHRGPISSSRTYATLQKSLGNDCAVRPSVAIRLDTIQFGKRDSAKV